MSDRDIPVKETDYIKLVSLNVNFGCFTFDSQEYVYVAPGLVYRLCTLSVIMAYFFMESLDEDILVHIMIRGLL